MPFFLSDKNKADLEKLDQSIQALNRKKRDILNAIEMSDTPKEQRNKLKLDYAAINEVRDILVLIKKHIMFVVYNPAYSNDEISQFLNPISNDEQLDIKMIHQEKYIKALISQALAFKDEQETYFIKMACGFSTLSVLAMIAIAAALIFHAHLIVILLLDILLIVGILLSFAEALDFYDRKKTFNEIQNHLKNTQDGKPTPLEKENTTFINYTVHNNEASATVNHALVKSRNDLRFHFFASDESGKSLANEILNQSSSMSNLR